MWNNLGHLFTYKTGPQNYYQKLFKHEICIIDDNNLIHNNNNYNNLQFCLRRLAVNKMATNIWRYFTLRMRNYPWHISIRLANIYSILSSINIYPLLNTVLKTCYYGWESRFITFETLCNFNSLWQCTNRAHNRNVMYCLWDIISQHNYLSLT